MYKGLVLLLLLPFTNSISGTVITVQTSTILPETVIQFGQTTNYYFLLTSIPINYQTHNRNYTLNEYKIEIYSRSIQFLRAVKIPDRYQAGYVNDISNLYLAMTFQNGTNEYVAKVFDVEGNEVFKSPSLSSSLGTSAQLFGNLLQVSSYNDTSPEVYTISKYNLTSGQIWDSDRFQLPNRVTEYGNARIQTVSSPIPLNDTTSLIVMKNIYFLDEIGNKQVMRIYTMKINTDTGKITSKNFKSSICDNGFNDKKDQFDIIHPEEDCLFIPDYKKQEILFIRKMILENGNTMIYVTNPEGTELSVELLGSIPQLEPYQYQIDEENRLHFFFLQHYKVTSGLIDCVNFDMNFTSGDILIRRGSISIEPTLNFLFSMNFDSNQLTFYSATLSGITKTSSNLTPQMYVPPPDLSTNSRESFTIVGLGGILIYYLMRKRNVKGLTMN